MKERRIHLNGLELKAALAENLTLLWRVVKDQPHITNDTAGRASWGDSKAQLWRNEKQYARDCCPYGVPGDRLWVPEEWGLWDTEPSDGPVHARVFYRATDGDRHDLRHQLWRPSSRMPRWASRLRLEIVSVRVAPVQSVSEADARAAGVAPEPVFDPCNPEAGVAKIARPGFVQFWDSVHASRGLGWDSSPWAWVIECQPRLTQGAP